MATEKTTIPPDNAEPDNVPKLRPAPMGRRAFAAIIDILLVTITFQVASFSLVSNVHDDNVSFILFVSLFLVIAGAAYWVIPEWMTNATLGKIFLGLRVTTLKGKDCSLAQSFKRNLTRFVVDSQVSYLVGFIVALNNPRRQRLGDMWADTMVITVQDARRLGTMKRVD